MANNYNFKNLDEMVKWVLANSHRNSYKWNLWDRTDMVWDDEEAGKAWEAMLSEVRSMPGYHDWRNDCTPEEVEAFKSAEEAVFELKPTQHQEKYYYLTEAGEHWHADQINLSEELGDAIDGIWTKREAYRGASYQKRVGSMTVGGMLKRLGKSDIADQVAEAKKREEAIAAKNGRNYARRQAVKMAKELKELLEKNPELGIGSMISVEALLGLVEEE